MTMEEAMKRAVAFLPDSTHRHASISFDWDKDGNVRSRHFSLDLTRAGDDNFYAYSGGGSCWYEAVDNLAKVIQGNKDLKETVAEADGKQG